MRTLIVLSVLLFVATGGRVCSEEKAKPVHLFILDGQSNMGVMKPEVYFLPEAKRVFPDEEIIYYHYGPGGVYMWYWVDEYPEIIKKHGMERALKLARRHKKRLKARTAVFYKRMLGGVGKLLEEHPEPASVTLCWMHGETDAAQGLQNAYKDALKQLISNLRRDLKRPDMNVVIGRVSDHSSKRGWKAMRKIQVEVAEEDPRGAWVDCDDLNDIEKDGEIIQGIHYKVPEGYQVLARRFAKQAKALAEGKEPAADGRPCVHGDEKGKEPVAQTPKSGVPPPRIDDSRRSVNRKEVCATGSKHLFILSGQSNMAYLDPNTSFTPTIEKEFGAENAIIVKYARSARHIKGWDEGYPKEVKNPWKRVVPGSLYCTLMAAVDKATKGQEIATATFIWLQGESDSTTRAMADLYGTALRNVISQMKRDLKRDDLNVVIVRLNRWKTGKFKYYDIIRKQQVEIAESDPRYTWVNTDDLGGHLHHTREGRTVLGRRFAESAIELIGKHRKEPAADGRP